MDRAIKETREALSALALKHSLTGALMSLCTLIDSVTIEVTSQQGESAFELHEETETVLFRTSTLRQIVDQIESLAAEIGILELDEVRRVRQLAINLFVIHELLHIRQNFPHFATVAVIKSGLSGIGLPMLDLAADTVSAWVCAHVEVHRVDDETEESVLRHYVNALVLAYVIGAFVYDSRSTPGKRQRALGLVVSAMLVQAHVDGRLIKTAIYDGWQPISPVLVLDPQKSGAFNAMVIDSVPGLLLPGSLVADEQLVLEFWDSVGKPPVQRTLSLGAQLLALMGALRD